MEDFINPIVQSLPSETYQNFSALPPLRIAHFPTNPEIADDAFLQCTYPAPPDSQLCQFPSTAIYEQLTVFLYSSILFPGRRFVFETANGFGRLGFNRTETEMGMVYSGQAELTTIVMAMSQDRLRVFPDGYIGPLMEASMLFIHRQGFLGERRELNVANLLDPIITLCLSSNTLITYAVKTYQARQRRQLSYNNENNLSWIQKRDGTAVLILLQYFQLLLWRTWRGKIITFFNLPADPLQGSIRNLRHLIQLYEAKQVRVVTLSTSYVRMMEQQVLRQQQRHQHHGNGTEQHQHQHRIGGYGRSGSRDDDKQDPFVLGQKLVRECPVQVISVLGEKLVRLLVQNKPEVVSSAEGLDLLRSTRERVVFLTSSDSLALYQQMACDVRYRFLYLDQFSSFFTGAYTNIPSKDRREFRQSYRILVKAELNRILRAARVYTCVIHLEKQLYANLHQLIGVFYITISLFATSFCILFVEIVARCCSQQKSDTGSQLIQLRSRRNPFVKIQFPEFGHIEQFYGQTDLPRPRHVLRTEYRMPNSKYCIVTDPKFSNEHQDHSIFKNLVERSKIVY